MAKIVFKNNETADLRESKGSGRIDQWLARLLLKLIGEPAITFILPDGTPVTNSPNNSRGSIVLNDRSALLYLIINPEYYFGELYTMGRIDVEGNLVDLLCEVYRKIYATDKNPYHRVLYYAIRNVYSLLNLDNARENIYHHYDIGNSFYQLWLDKEMQYTCAYFAEKSYTLEQAQIAKMHHVCRKLMLSPGQTVVEAGCGWGGLSRFMAREYGVNVRAYNISREQVKYAREQAKKEGLSDKVEYVEDDFRNIRGKYDVFVSVGMLEHVGIQNYRILGKVINSCLKENGIGLVHSIGFNRPRYMNQWIEKRIFPGANPPSISQIMTIFEPFDFSILDIENLRLHYARTLEQWLNRFDTHSKQIQDDFDEQFIRSWRLYLCGSISAFLNGNMQLFQVVFSRMKNNSIPLSRAYLYTGSRDNDPAEL
jgi:cyclopropane-fatty-acyl-phospholipid synthase